MTTITDRLSGISTSVAVKPPCKAVAIANITLSGEQTVNGVAVVEGDRVLVTAQTSSVNNGIYVASTSAWTRAADFDGSRDVVNGTLVVVNRSVGRDVFYQVNATDPVVVGTSAIEFLLLNDPNVSFPITDAEIAAGLDESDINESYPPYPYNLLRAGLVPNSTGARSANSAALAALLDPTTNGPRGRFVFPNTTGSDTYYLDAQIIQVRDGCTLDLCGCTLDIAGAFDLDNDLQGFFTFIRDVTIENGTINVDYDGTGGTNNGLLISIGSRGGYPFGSFTNGIEEEDLTEFMGNCALRNLRLRTNNNAPTVGVLLLGGLHNVTIENIEFDGASAVENGFYYEFGDYHLEATIANRTTTHAVNLVFRNLYGHDLKTTGGGALLHIVGANSAILDGIHCDTCGSVVAFRNGEALYYNVGAPYENGGGPRWQIIRNVTGQNCASGAISLEGSESAAAGYLAGEGLSDSEQRDLQGFILQGFSVDSSVSFTGPSVVEGGTIRGAAASGGIIVGEDCGVFAIRNVNIYDCGNAGIRAEIANSALGSSRDKRGVIEGCVIAGNDGQAITLGLCDGVLVRGNQLGYSTDFNEADETTQTSAVNVAADGHGVVCDSNYVKTAAGTAYVLAGDGDRGCDVRHTRGDRNRSGEWMVDGLAQHNATDIADVDAVINTASKYAGKAVRDTSNNRILYARGSAAADPWDLADGSASVTPS